MKRWCLCLSFLMLVFPSFISSEDMTAADVAASVNGRTVGMASYLREYSNLKERYRAQYGEYPGAEDEPHIQKVVLDNLIAQELLLEECEKAGITADRAYVNEEMDYYRNQFPDDQSFTEALSKEGISREELSERIAHSRQIETLISERIAKGISVTESEGREYYAKHPEAFTQPERVRASHILIAYEKGATPQQRKDAYSRIEAIKERIQAGESFSALAKEYSDCPSGKDGGDLGFFARGDMVPEFENAAFSLNTGEMSGIVESEFGFHLILVTEREAESILPYDAVKSELESYLSEEKIQQAVLAFIDDLMKKANIKYYVNFGG